jgi:hypothetical protein
MIKMKWHMDCLILKDEENNQSHVIDVVELQKCIDEQKTYVVFDRTVRGMHTMNKYEDD